MSCVEEKKRSEVPVSVSNATVADAKEVVQWHHFMNQGVRFAWNADKECLIVSVKRHRFYWPVAPSEWSLLDAVPLHSLAIQRAIAYWMHDPVCHIALPVVRRTIVRELQQLLQARDWVILSQRWSDEQRMVCNVLVRGIPQKYGASLTKLPNNIT